jgi:hypothetical protein
MKPLLTYLANTPADGRFRQWRVMRIGGSANNILYRATSGEADLAVKFTIRDARRRARREYHALIALREVGLDVAPRPILLDETSYAQPVVVQSWLGGRVTADPPQADDEWRQLIAHYATLASITPDKVTAPIETAVINFANAAEGHTYIQKLLSALPANHQPPILPHLIQKLLLTRSPGTRSPAHRRPQVAFTHTTADRPLPQALCRVDANTLNFLRRPGRWASVDWENSGWGDPAFEIVDMMCHPQYHTVSAARWAWVMALYGEMVADETAVARIQALIPFMLVWWVARLALMLYQVPRGGDQRLIQRDPDWQADIQMKLNRYIDLAQSALEGTH